MRLLLVFGDLVNFFYVIRGDSLGLVTNIYS